MDTSNWQLVNVREIRNKPSKAQQLQIHKWRDA